MNLAARLDAQQRRRPWLGFPLAVAYKYFDDYGGYLAALITYYAFVSLVPLVLVLATILSFVLSSRPDLQQQILNSALSQIPVVGAQLENPKTLSGGTVGTTIALLVAAYGGLGVGNAAQYALNTVWTIPRNSRPNPITARVRSLGLVLTAGLAIIATTAVSTVGALATGWTRSLLSLAITLFANTVIFHAVFRWGVSRLMPIRTHLPGAVLAALLLQIVQTFGVVYIGRVVHDASTTNGIIGFVLGMIAFLYLVAVIFVVCAEVNVVRVRALYPRALLTPFTDAVDLTPADVRAYAGQATSMRAKGFEVIRASFGRDPEGGRAEDTNGRPPK